MAIPMKILPHKLQKKTSNKDCSSHVEVGYAMFLIWRPVPLKKDRLHKGQR